MVLPKVKEIQAKAYYNEAEVEIALTEEPTLISGADGSQGTLVSTGLEASNVCGGEQTPANRALLWQSGDKSFILFSFLDQLDGRGFLTKMEMRQFAENLNGFTASREVELDPERLLSVKDAETLSGLDIKMPTLILAGLHLNHIAYVHDGPYGGNDIENRVALLYTGKTIGDGRAYKLLTLQTFSSTNTLENLALAGGYDPAVVNGQPAIYRQDCWEVVNGSPSCMSFLSWFEGNVQFDVEALLPAALPKETIIAIAESMR